MKINSEFSENALPDDKNLNKKRSFVNSRVTEQNNPGFEQDIYEDFIPKNNLQISQTEIFGQRNNNNWNSGRSNAPYQGGMAESVRFEPKGLNFFEGTKTQMKQDVGKMDDYKNSPRYMGIKGKADFKYPGNMYSDGTQEDSNIPMGFNNQRDFQNPNNFFSAKEMVKMYPTFDVPTPIDYSAANNFGFDGTDYCKADKAIIINLKTECPLSRQSNSRVVHRYIYPPKLTQNTYQSPHLVPGSNILGSTAGSALYYS